ncbi:response regulator [Nitrospirillum pindoramense]|uniref:Response regulator receiver domain-containing protein n=1 Tax=Nitrospirillum amazonense TaxID=28077 RepID=A0A560HFH1_9PROT|nr:response regulator [Nitrospirillum amazonense]TWB44234.1 response regulator receiver domain-containing protein [Nitrospirillum amazonense]
MRAEQTIDRELTQRSSTARRPRYRIVVVEDEALIALGLEQILLHQGHEVCAVAASVDEAVEAVDRHRPDLVLMDVMLRGGGDGVEAADRIWKRFGIRSLFTSAVDANILRSRAASVSLGFITKPYRPEDFQRSLSALSLA